MRITQQARVIAIIAALLVAVDLWVFGISVATAQPVWRSVLALVTYGAHIVILVVALNIAAATWNLAHRVERIERHLSLPYAGVGTPLDIETETRREDGE